MVPTRRIKTLNEEDTKNQFPSHLPIPKRPSFKNAFQVEYMYLNLSSM